MVPIVPRPGTPYAPWRARSRFDRALPGLLILGMLSGAAFAAQRVSVKLEGEIVPECTVGGAGGASLNLGDVSKPGARDYVFALSCNGPFSFKLAAQHGALTRDGAEAGGDAANTIPYSVSVLIPTSRAPVESRCSGESLRADRLSCASADSGDAIALDTEARLSLSWGATTMQQLPGTYREVLTMSFGIAE